MPSVEPPYCEHCAAGSWDPWSPYFVDLLRDPEFLAVIGVDHLQAEAGLSSLTHIHPTMRLSWACTTCARAMLRCYPVVREKDVLNICDALLIHLCSLACECHDPEKENKPPRNE